MGYSNSSRGCNVGKPTQMTYPERKRMYDLPWWRVLAPLTYLDVQCKHNICLR